MASSNDLGQGRRGRDQRGVAIVETALLMPLLLILLGVAFTGWDAMHQSVQLTSAARAGALKAASDLDAQNAICDPPNNKPSPAQMANAKNDAITAINTEENSAAFNTNNVSVSCSASTIDGISASFVTVTITQPVQTFVPLVPGFTLTTHATARFA